MPNRSSAPLPGRHMRAAAVLAALALPGAHALAAEPTAGAPVATPAAVLPDLPQAQRLVLRFTPDAAGRLARERLLAEGVPAPGRERALRAAPREGTAGAAPQRERLLQVRAMAAGGDVLAPARPLSARETTALAMRLARLPGVLSAEPDQRVQPQALAGDAAAAMAPAGFMQPAFTPGGFMRPAVAPGGFTQPAASPGGFTSTQRGQWPLWGPAPSPWPDGRAAAVPGGSGFAGAWAQSAGQGVTVAVLDTGSVTHPSMAGQELPGHDFIGDAGTAGDGGGRDADPSDPGDACDGRPASWHGLKVASQIAARPTADGIVGGAPQAQVMHARVLGRCGGWLSDTADAIDWIAGTPLPGLPRPAASARVINLSLGSNGACPAYMQAAIDRAVAAGVTVVAATGNSGLGEISSPANCRGVIAVAAHTASGDLAGYSNHSAAVSLTGPAGGACRQQAGTACDSTPSWAAGNAGTTVPGAAVMVAGFAGTSAATPHVAAAAALVISLRPAWTPAQVLGHLQRHARPHPAGTYCAARPGLCGAGMLDAQAAVAALAAPAAAALSVQAPAGAVPRGRTVTLAARATAEGDWRWAWRQTAGPAAALSGADTATASVGTPADASGTLQFEVTATDSTGRMLRALAAVTVNNPPQLADARADGVAGQRLRVPLPARDDEGEPLVLALLGDARGALADGAALVWPLPVAGTHAFQVQAQDAGGQRSRVATVTLAVAPAPVALRVLGPTAPVARSARVTLTAQLDGFAAGAALRWQQVGGPAVGSVRASGTGLQFQAPSRASGVVTFRLTATDAAGRQATAERAVVVDSPPVVQAGSATVEAGRPARVPVRASDPEGGALTLHLVGDARGAVIDGGAIVWAQAPSARTTVQVVARDAAGQASAPAAYTVSPRRR